MAKSFVNEDDLPIFDEFSNFRARISATCRQSPRGRCFERLECCHGEYSFCRCGGRHNSRLSFGGLAGVETHANG